MSGAAPAPLGDFVGERRGNARAAANVVDTMKNEAPVCTCGHVKPQHNPAGRCLVQATSQPTGRGQRQQKICGCLHFRAVSSERPELT